ncbi:hypothetical protein P7K49_022710 [Saguinus oedipus]|uniref:Uncharacterized protein n=1 Tax=Saguinus oedipus TaxID=9490 RepID=A0ABQ9UJM3_SAGOE|nr:hypothetical protein P7K49_022710 [Saguinus oedipus]
MTKVTDDGKHAPGFSTKTMTLPCPEIGALLLKSYSMGTEGGQGERRAAPLTEDGLHGAAGGAEREGAGRGHGQRGGGGAAGAGAGRQAGCHTGAHAGGWRVDRCKHGQVVLFKDTNTMSKHPCVEEACDVSTLQKALQDAADFHTWASPGLEGR